MKKTEHCKPIDYDNNSVLCHNKISLYKLLQFLPPNERNAYSNDMIMTLFLHVTRRQYPYNFTYCPNTTCKYANEILDLPTGKKNYYQDEIYCKVCNCEHYVHFHNQTCPECKTSFCSVCKMTPYHDNEVCQGPMHQVDSETMEILLDIMKC